MSKQTAITKPLRQVKSVQELLVNDMAKQQLQIVAAQHMKPERMMRLMANAIRTTPKLGQCEPLTLLGSMMTCASLGLEPNTVLGHAYLIPFENRKKGVTEVQLVLGYTGMVDLARRSGHVVNIHADVVYEADDFSFEYGSNQHLKHIPAGERSKPIYAYCHAKLTDGEAFIVLPYAEVLKVRDSSQGYKTAKKYGKTDTPWIAHEHQMARKTAVRALFNELPISVEKVTEALEVDGSQANFANFAMHPDQGSPETGETIEAEAISADEEQNTASEREPETPIKDKGAEGEKATGEAPKEHAQDRPADDKPEEENEEFSGLVNLIANELCEAEDAGAVEAVLEIYGSQIAQTEGTPYHDQITEAADARREELAQ
jgi:recombination protein RecT